MTPADIRERTDKVYRTGDKELAWLILSLADVYEAAIPIFSGSAGRRLQEAVARVQALKP